MSQKTNVFVLKLANTSIPRSHSFQAQPIVTLDVKLLK